MRREPQGNKRPCGLMDKALLGFRIGPQSAATPNLHVGHLAVTSPSANSRPKMMKMMGGKYGLPACSRSGKAPRELEPRSLDSEPRVLAVTPRSQLSLLGTTGRKLPESAARRAGGPGGRAGSLSQCDSEASVLVVALACNMTVDPLVNSMTPAGLEPAISGSVSRCLIHWATGPIAL
jgi:hypothetical protein